MSHGAGAQRPVPSRGDHLCVRRRWGYDHHGIYISDSRGIQFGGDICDKVHANIEAVSLETFKDGGAVEVVAHGGKQRWFRWFPWFGAWLPPADPPEARRRLQEQSSAATLREIAEQFDISQHSARRKEDGLVAQGKLTVEPGSRIERGSTATTRR